MYPTLNVGTARLAFMLFATAFCIPVKGTVVPGTGDAAGGAGAALVGAAGAALPATGAGAGAGAGVVAGAAGAAGPLTACSTSEAVIRP